VSLHSVYKTIRIVGDALADLPARGGLWSRRS
jgi:hypothetical protein